MPEEKKPIVWMILFGVSRHLLTIIGTWMVSRGLIDADTHERLVSEGAVQLAGIVLMALPVAWSVLQKVQVVSWLRTALHLTSSTPIGEIPKASAGPDMPI